MMAKRTPAVVRVLVCVALLLISLQLIMPSGEPSYLFAIGWIYYLARVVPQLHVNGAGVATAAFCLAALVVGLQWFLHWFTVQMSQNTALTDPTVRSWPIRRTVVIVGLIVLLFIAGIAVVGISHQTGWLLNAPESIFQRRSFQEMAARTQSQNNLKQITLAMINYSDTVAGKSLPPTALLDRQGRPLLSWRVLLLPYLEHPNLYMTFHLDEPWDSPYNLQFLPPMPNVYDSPSFPDTDKPYRTHYQVFVGKGTAFEGNSGLRYPDDFPDGTSNTILIVEAAEAVPWTKPADLPYSRQHSLPAEGWRSPDVFLAAMADGSVRTINLPEVKESTLRAAITRNGGETLGEDW